MNLRDSLLLLASYNQWMNKVDDVIEARQAVLDIAGWSGAALALGLRAFVAVIQVPLGGELGRRCLHRID